MSGFVYSKTFRVEMLIKVDSDEPLSGMDAEGACRRFNEKLQVKEWAPGVFAVDAKAQAPITLRSADPLLRIEAKLDELLAMMKAGRGREHGDRGADRGSEEARVQTDAQGDPGAAR
jgi:hypothetical protein